MAEPKDRYSVVSLIFHWGLALMVLAQVLLITAFADGDAPNARQLIGLHKSLGLTILVVTLARIAWRLANPAIPLPSRTPGWQKIVARTTHVLFYVMLLGLPLLGWASSSAGGREIAWFGLFNWPLLPLPLDRNLAKTLISLHGAGVKVLYVLIALHVLGALKHQFIDRDNVLRRMIPLLPRR
ncbi:cytochrome b [soil metagenome]